MLDRSKLQPYDGAKTKSFEQLCYQIAKKKYEYLGFFTPIDGSGGDGGVEFYMTQSNGDVWGRQCKFFTDNGRLNVSGRKNSIESSLETACRNHPQLKKLFICLKTDLTVASLSKGGKTSNGEKDRFDNVLSTKVPVEMSVELIHWGESELLNLLKDYSDIRRFFFSEKLLSQEWFEERYKCDIQKKQIDAKYNSKVHVPTNIDDAINKLLGGGRLVKILEKEILNQQIEVHAKNYEDACLKVSLVDVEDEYKNIQVEILKILYGKDKIIDHGINKLEEIKKLMLSKSEIELKIKIGEFRKYNNELGDLLQKYYLLTGLDLYKPLEYLRDNYEEPIESNKHENKYWFDNIKEVFEKILFKKKVKEYQPSTAKRESEETRKKNEKITRIREILFKPFYLLKNYAIPSLELCENLFDLLDQNELHISGEAGMGKTHVSFNIYEDQIKNQKQPAIFIFAKDIASNLSLENQLKENFGLPTDWSFDDFLSALEVTAKIHRVRIPIIIDGLNESTYWNTVWKSGLENLIIKVKKYPHVVLVTTYRKSYEDQLFPKEYFDYHKNKDWWKLKESVYGFEGLTWEAIDAYFQYYKIKLGNRSNAIGYFKHPLYLKLFCETKNPKHEEEVDVSFQNEDLFEVFDAYIKNSNNSITSSLIGLDSKYNKSFTEDKLLKISEYIWEKRTRGIPISENLLTTDELRIFESENLLIFRDWNQQSDREEIQFTYDLLGGYFISKYLIETYGEFYPLIRLDAENWLVNAIKTGLEFFIPERGTKLLEDGLNSISKKIGVRQSLVRFILSREFRDRLINKETEHPLFEDILRTICILFIKKDEIFLFSFLKDKRTKKYSIESLFEINVQYIKKNEEHIKAFLKIEFLGENSKTYLLDLAKNVAFDGNHPLNFDFWSDLLNVLSMPQRDLSWSEYVRKNHSYFSDFVKHFEEVSRGEDASSSRVHFAAKKVMRVLTTNIRRLRDEATRALYYYARRYPGEFLELLKYSLDINDPYILERMLAVSYGLAMARQNDLEDDSYKKEWLPQFGSFIFSTIFSKESTHSMTHILARDYAKRTIDIAILHYPDILTNDEKILIQYPLKEYKHYSWQEGLDRNEGEYRDGNAPIHMDFENYTIGRLVRDRRNYDGHHEEYKKVLSNIYWRIYDLGYSLEIFGEVDKKIASLNYSRYETEGKIDRYGKKYSWIAFYEMAGYRSDLSLLKDWDDEDEFRISDADIDPSFPVELKKYDLISSLGGDNFIGKECDESIEWCNQDNDLAIKKYLELDNTSFDSNGGEGRILLKGDIRQKDQDNQIRDIYISIGAVLIKNDHISLLRDMTSTYSDYGFERIEEYSSYYTFHGEVPWSDTMPNNGLDAIKITYNNHEVEDSKPILRYYNKGLLLEEVETIALEESIKELYVEENPDNEELSIYDFPGKRIFLFELSNEQKISLATKLGYKVEKVNQIEKKQKNHYLELEDAHIPVYRNSWEGYHSEINSPGEAIFPSKEICNFNNLNIGPQSSDLYDKYGILASTAFSFGDKFDDEVKFLYIRRDIIESYCKANNLTLVWFQWSEKRYFPKGIMSHDKESIYRTYYKIHYLNNS